MDSAQKSTLEKLIRQLWLENAWGFLCSHILQLTSLIWHYKNLFIIIIIFKNY